MAHTTCAGVWTPRLVAHGSPSYWHRLRTQTRQRWPRDPRGRSGSLRPHPGGDTSLHRASAPGAPGRNHAPLLVLSTYCSPATVLGGCRPRLHLEAGGGTTAHGADAPGQDGTAE